MAGFDAFISYSRRASTALATDLQVDVERFAKPWWRLRAVRVFRDDASMSANTALWSTIERGLRESGWLVLLASPLAAQSPYVAKEVAWWREHKAADRILIVLEDGVDIAWNVAAGDFDFERTDSLPRALSGAYAEEPRWIDLRWYEQPGSLGRQDPRWPERVADVAAAVRGVERDELVGENVRQHRRARRTLRAGVATLSVLLVASLVATYVAVGQRSEAQRQRDAADAQARVALARQLAAQAVSLADTDLPTASLLAVQAWRTHEDEQTRAALFEVGSSTPELVTALDPGHPVTATAVTPDGVVVTGDDDGGVVRWVDALPEFLFLLDGPVTDLAVSDDGSVVVGASAEGAVRWDGEETALAGRQPVAVSPDGGTVASTVDGGVSLWSGGGERVVDAGAATALTLTATELVGHAPAEFAVVELATGATVAQGIHVTGTQANGVALSADGATLVNGTGRPTLLAWQGEAARTDLAEPTATVEARVATSDIAVSASGAVVASLVEGSVELDAVRAPGDPAVPRVVLAGAGAPDGFGTLSFGGDRWLATGNGSTALVWDLERVTRLGSVFQARIPVGCGACPPGAVAVSPDGRSALLTALSSPVGPTTVDLSSGEARELSEDGLAAWGEDGSARTIDELGLPVPDDETPAALAVRGDDAVAVTLEGSVVTTAGRLSALDGVDAGGYVVVAPDLSTAALYSFADSLIRVVDVAADEVVAELEGLTMAYDARSRLHVFDGETDRVVEDGEVVETLAAEGVDRTPPVVVSPDGTTAVTGGFAGTDVQLLALGDERAPVASFAVPQDQDLYVVSAFSPDGTTLVTAVPGLADADDGQVRVLDLDPEAWVEAACALAARDLSEAEWERYGVGPAPSDLRCLQ